MNSRLLAGLVAGAALLAAAPPAFAGPTVSVRIEGETRTLLPRTTVTLPDTPAPGNGCPADSAANAIEVATRGDWDRQAFVQTILKETHAFERNDYWSFWVERGGRYLRANGICDQRLEPGDELLGHFDVFAEPDYAPTYLPLRIEDAPATIAPGRPFTVTVARYGCETSTCDPGQSRRVSAEGALVRVGAAFARADSEGRATLTVHDRGELSVIASHPRGVDAHPRLLCSTTGSDGLCGTQACVTNGRDGLCGTRDRTPPVSRITEISQGTVFGRRFAPRELTGSVTADPSGLHAVKLRIIRRAGERCWYFSARRERFVRSRCGRAFWFGIGRESNWSYYLPAALRRGYYAVQVKAVDGAFNRETGTERGRSLIEFRVQ